MKPIFYIFIFFTLKLQAQKCLETKMSSFVFNQPDLETIKTYDKFGNLLSYTEKSIGNLAPKYTKKTINEYNNKNKIIKTISFLNENLISETLNTYDSNNNILSESSNNQIKSIYSIKGNTKEKIHRDKNQTNGVKEITVFDDNQKELEYKLISNNGDTMSLIQKTYNTNGFILRKTHEDYPAKMTFETLYEYDSNNLLVKETELLNQKLNYFTTYNYFDKLLKEKTKYNKNNKVEYKLQFEYNENRLQITEKYLYNEELVSTKNSEYDSKQNKISDTYTNNKNQITKKIIWEYICN
jgi:hypothetical protein